MFEITPRPLAEAVAALKKFSGEIPGLWEQLSIAPGADSSEDRPFVQMSYDEVPEEDVETFLGYSDLHQSNRPIGLPFRFEPRVLGENTADELLLFPIDGFEAHLRQAAPEIASALDRYGSMDAFVDSKDEEEDITAREYLVGGVLECIRYCREKNEALVIRW